MALLKLLTFATAFTTLLAGGALAQEVSDCDWRGNARNVVEPWEEGTRTFANGNVRLVLLDTIEPAAGAFHLMILSPPYAELGDRQCRIISYSGSVGFAGISFEALEASYDPARGLTFRVPTMIYLPESSFSNSAQLEITLNQATGDITITTKLGNE